MPGLAPTARFIVRCCRPSSVGIEGRFDAGAAVGFDAVVAWLIGDPNVVIDLRGCDVVDDAAHRAVDDAVRRIEGAGGTVRVLA